MSKLTRGNVTLVLILLLNEKSWRKRFRWMHRVSGSTVTREYFKPLRSFLPGTEEKEKRRWGNFMLQDSLDQRRLTFFTAIHVVSLKFVRGEEIGEAIIEGDVWAVKESGDPAPCPGHPATPTAISAHVLTLAT